MVRPGRTQDRLVLSVRVQDTFSHIEITLETVEGLRRQPVPVWVLGADEHRHVSVAALIEHHHHVPIEIVGKDAVLLHPPEKGGR